MGFQAPFFSHSIDGIRKAASVKNYQRLGCVFERYHLPHPSDRGREEEEKEKLTSLPENFYHLSPSLFLVSRSRDHGCDIIANMHMHGNVSPMLR